MSDFRVMGDQRGLFGPVASVPAVWRVLKEIAGGGRRKITATVSTARRRAWAQGGGPVGGPQAVAPAVLGLKERQLRGNTSRTMGGIFTWTQRIL